MFSNSVNPLADKDLKQFVFRQFEPNQRPELIMIPNLAVPQANEQFRNRLIGHNHSVLRQQ